MSDEFRDTLRALLDSHEALITRVTDLENALGDCMAQAGFDMGELTARVNRLETTLYDRYIRLCEREEAMLERLKALERKGAIYGG